MTTEVKEYQGSCHCGRVTFTVSADPAASARCNCSLCRRKGTPMMMTEAFVLNSGAADLGCYQFNTMTAKHYFCRHCGIYTHHNPRSNPALTRVNAGCLEGVDPFTLDCDLIDGASLS
mgnify:CR=1 FL=1